MSARAATGKGVGVSASWVAVGVLVLALAAFPWVGDLVGIRFPTSYEMRLVVRGMLNKQIAADLGAAEKTIKIHRGRVMKKMQADSVANLVRMAQRLGLEVAIKPHVDVKDGTFRGEIQPLDRAAWFERRPPISI